MLGLVSVKGEVSGKKESSSGHIYFDLKDEEALIHCAIWNGKKQKGLKFTMENGQQVIVSGKIDVYERNGEYRLYAEEIKQDGQGDLFIQFEALKKKLEEMGMFDPIYKKRIPTHIRRLGIVTAPTGAAVQDIINISKRRNPYLEIIVCPALVQGEQAAESIAQGIAMLDQYGVDVIIAGRGGGSMEDLWAFNEEVVARAIFDCKTPIISAVGHETDFTIADFVADLRAPTPSAAAELAVYEVSSLEETMEGYRKRLDYLWNSHFEAGVSRLERIRVGLNAFSPMRQMNEKRTRLLAIEDRFDGLMEQRILEKRHRMQIYIERFKGLSPLSKLGSGYGYVENESGKAVTDIHSLSEGDRITVMVANGKITADVVAATEITYPGTSE